MIQFYQSGKEKSWKKGFTRRKVKKKKNEEKSN
jgi:hypothetical protein